MHPFNPSSSVQRQGSTRYELAHGEFDAAYMSKTSLFGFASLDKIRPSHFKAKLPGFYQPAYRKTPYFGIDGASEKLDDWVWRFHLQ